MLAACGGGSVNTVPVSTLSVSTDANGTVEYRLPASGAYNGPLFVPNATSPVPNETISINASTAPPSGIPALASVRRAGLAAAKAEDSSGGQLLPLLYFQVELTQTYTFASRTIINFPSTIFPTGIVTNQALYELATGSPSPAASDQNSGWLFGTGGGGGAIGIPGPAGNPGVPGNPGIPGNDGTGLLINATGTTDGSSIPVVFPAGTTLLGGKLYGFGIWSRTQNAATPSPSPTAAPTASPTPTPAPTASPSPAPSPTASAPLIVSSEAMLITATGSAGAQTFTASETGYAGTFTITDPACSGVASVTPASASGPRQTFTVTGIANGSCDVVITDQLNQGSELTVTVRIAP